MEQVTAVGKGTTVFLLLVLAASATATSLNTTQQNTAITATSDRQVRSVGGACAYDSGHFKSMWSHSQYTPYNHILSLSTEKGHSHISYDSLQIQQCWGDMDGRGRATG